jgi:hypothetical protein
LLLWLHKNSDIVDTLILRCGVFTCCRTGCGECGGQLNTSRCGKPAGSCENNGGVGGVITGNISAACHRVLPELRALGIKAELWLGNDDSLISARHLLQRPNESSAALLDLARQNSFISGFNFDLEAGGGVVADGLLHRAFLEQVSALLSPAGLRLSSDVACSNYAGIWGRPLASNCSLLGSANLKNNGRIMNMATYNAGNYDEWMSALGYALQAPLHNLGVGLGVYQNAETKHSWNTNASSAADRICALMNHSVSEIDIFDLQPPTAPEEFWPAQLRKFKKGGGCAMKLPKKIVCPQGRVRGAWRPGGEGADCCESNARRSPTIECNITCAQAECAASHGRWAPKNYSRHPFECCGAHTPPLKIDDADDASRPPPTPIGRPCTKTGYSLPGTQVRHLTPK